MQSWPVAPAGGVGVRMILVHLIVVSGLLASGQVASGATNYHMGLDFIESPVGIIQYLEAGSGFDPFPLTGPGNYSVQDGGLAGWTESQARRGVAMAVDDVFRAVDTGNPDATLRAQIHVGAVPTSIPGRRINVIMGASQDPDFRVLGSAVWGAALFDVQYPNDSYTAVVYLDELDRLGDYDASVRFTTSSSIFNNIAGTVAHEIGHEFILGHLDRGSVQPYPIMATAKTDLLITDRLTARRFDDAPGAQLDGHSSESKLVSHIGTALRADFDLTDVVDSDDADIIRANWLLTDRLFQEGDANADHVVDSDDASAVNRSWLNTHDLAAAGTATADYDPATGDLRVSGSNVCQIGIVSESAALGIIGEVNWQGGSGTLHEETGSWRVVESALGTNMPDFVNHLMFTAAAGMPAGQFDLLVRYQTLNGTVEFADVTYIPEPGTMAMLAVGSAAALVRRRRRK